MNIIEATKEHTVIDYNFMFPGGSKLTVTVDVDAGDAVQEFGDRYVITTTPKPSLSDSDEFSDGEEITVFKPNLAAVAKCERKQRLPSEEELFDMRKLIHGVAKNIQ